MKHVPVRTALFGLILIVISRPTFATPPRVHQEASASSRIGPLTAEERTGLESMVLSDKRVRQIFGERKPRFIITEAETDKAEAEAFLEGTTEKRPSRRVSIALFDPKTNRAAHVSVLFEERRILEVQEIKAEDVPLSREDAEDAFSLAKANAELRRALGERGEQFRLADANGDVREPFVVEALPLRSTNPRDPCSKDRCLDLIFRTEEGYLPLRAHVDLTKRTVAVETKKGNEGGEHP